MIEEWKKIRPEKIFVIFGLILIAVSVTMPWLTARTTALFPVSVSRTGLELSPDLSYLALFCFISGSMTVWFDRRFTRSGIICLAMSLIMLAGAAIVYPELESRAASSGTDIVVTIESGVYLFIIGAFLTLLGSLKVIALSRNPLVMDFDLSDTDSTTDTNTQQDTKPTEQMFCSQCGKPLKQNAKFCPNCGEAVDS